MFADEGLQRALRTISVLHGAYNPRNRETKFIQSMEKKTLSELTRKRLIIRPVHHKHVWSVKG